jgi:hypothetical protein
MVLRVAIRSVRRHFWRADRAQGATSTHDAPSPLMPQTKLRKPAGAILHCPVRGQTTVKPRKTDSAMTMPTCHATHPEQPQACTAPSHSRAWPQQHGRWSQLGGLAHKAARAILVVSSHGIHACVSNSKGGTGAGVRDQLGRGRGEGTQLQQASKGACVGNVVHQATGAARYPAAGATKAPGFRIEVRLLSDEMSPALQSNQACPQP